MRWPERRARLDALTRSFCRGSHHGAYDLDGVADLAGRPDTSSELLQQFRHLTLDLAKDFVKIRNLAKGPQSAVALVKCLASPNSLLLVRKSVNKVWAVRMRGQMSPFHERAVLIKAAREKRPDIPLLVCCLQDDFDLYTILEYAPCGDVWQVMESSPDGCIEEDLLRHWVAEGLLALDWLHSAGWVHRDVKPHNLLLDQQGHIKLTDFGSAAPLDPNGRVLPIYCSVVVGTIDYIAPETLLAHQHALEQLEDSTSGLGDVAVSPLVDWWALGIILYEGLYGNAPFFAQTVAETYDRILDHKTLRVLESPSVSAAARDLISRLLVSQARRPNFAVIKRHPFFSQVDWKHLRACDLTDDYAAIQERDSILLSPSQSMQSVKAFDFSAFFSSPGLSILRNNEADESLAPIPDDWSGFTYLPPADVFDSPALQASTSTTHVDLAHQTPARNVLSNSASRRITASSKKRRTVSGLQAFVQVAEYGLQSVKKRRSATPSGNPWGELGRRQQRLLMDIDGVQGRLDRILKEQAGQGTETGAPSKR